MGLLSRTHITTLPLTVAERLDAVCDRFEAACGGGLRPGSAIISKASRSPRGPFWPAS